MCTTLAIFDLVSIYVTIPNTSLANGSSCTTVLPSPGWQSAGGQTQEELVSMRIIWTCSHSPFFLLSGGKQLVAEHKDSGLHMVTRDVPNQCRVIA